MVKGLLRKHIDVTILLTATLLLLLYIFYVFLYTTKQSKYALFTKKLSNEDTLRNEMSLFNTELPKVVTNFRNDLQKILPKTSGCKQLRIVNLREVTGVFIPVKGRPIFVYSAFYDNRKAAGGPLIRIVASGLQAEYNRVKNFYCILWYDNSEEGIPVPAEYHRIYQSTLHHDEYTAHFINCKVDNSRTVPRSVSVVGDLCNETDYSLLIISKQPSRKSSSKSAFGLCLSPIYNRFNDVGQMIEFLEIHRILGVTKFTLYDFAIGSKVKELLGTYVNDGVLEIIPWHIKPNLRQFYFSQREALNDCLYRNMYVVDFLAVQDLDEVIVPRMTSSWRSMMKNMSSSDIGAYLFQHVYFKRNTPTGAMNHRLITQTSFTRTSKVTPPGKIRCKSIYEPKRVLKIDIHFPYELLPNQKELIIDPKIAMLHHYRAQTMQMSKKPGNNITFITDRYMTRFGSRLIKAYNARMKLIR